MEFKRILYTGNLVRDIYAGDRKLFMENIMIQRDIWNQELVLLEKTGEFLFS